MPLYKLARHLPLARTPNKRLEGKHTSLRGDTFVNAIPALLQHSRRLPRILGIAQPQADQVASNQKLSAARPRCKSLQNTYCFSAESRNPARAWKMLRLLTYWMSP